LSKGARGSTNGDEDHVSLLVADHCAHKQLALDNLIRLLGNHGKQVLLLLTVNPEEFDKNETESKSDLRLAQFHGSSVVEIAHGLDDREIDDLFSKVSNDNPSVKSDKERLTYLARAEDQAKRDLLLILYIWFDKNYRRLDEIIAEEGNKLIERPRLLELYLSVAVFHQYNLSPRINLCLRACGIGIVDFADLRKDPFFQTFVKLSGPQPDRSEDSFTRHPDFTRKIVQMLCPEHSNQVKVMIKVLRASEQKDLQFVRSIFDYIYEFGLGFTVEEVTELKQATEEQRLFERDVILNHRFAAYLIREKADLELARYYLDIADSESPSRNPAITHSLGALNYAKFQILIQQDRQEAMKHYRAAKDYFDASRRAKPIPDEYGFVTDCDMTRYLLENTPSHDVAQRAVLEGENQSLMFEALQTVPKDGQNYITRRLQYLRRFRELSPDVRKVLEDEIDSGEASAGMISYYAESLLGKGEAKNWHKLARLIEIYEKSSDIQTLIQVGILSKRAFLKPAITRFEGLRKLYDSLIKFKDSDIGFVSLSEYIRLLQVDAFVLGKFDFLRSLISDVRDIFKYAFPRFLKDEYILKPEFYSFDPGDREGMKLKFLAHVGDFEMYNALSTARFTRTVELPDPHEIYFNVQIDPTSRLFVRGVRKELATDKRRIDLTFSIKHSFDGLKATDFNV
jgi:hypothetical protein